MDHIIKQITYILLYLGILGPLNNQAGLSYLPTYPLTHIYIHYSAVGGGGGGLLGGPLIIRLGPSFFPTFPTYLLTYIII